MSAKLRPVDPRWIRGPIDEIAVEQGCRFDQAAGEYACRFIESYCRQSKGRWRGQLIALMEWERDLLMRLYGWKGPDGKRRYKRGYLEVGKKNGKSCLLSAISLELLVADGEGGPEVHLNACDRDQAAIIFDEAREMVLASDQLVSRLTIVDSAKRIVDPMNSGVLRANSKVVSSKDGRGPSAVIFDELHRQPDRKMWGVYKYAGSARDQFLLLSLTTAGESDEGVWHEQREYSEAVNAPSHGDLLEDVTHLGIVYRCDPADDLDDPAVWRKANPSMGVTIDERRFAQEWKEAQRTPEDLADFMRYRFCIIMAGEQAFLAPGVWDACNGDVDLEALRGREFCAGLDLSSVKDVSALVALYGDADWGYDIRAHFWLPRRNIVELERTNNAPYRAWAERGYITLTDANTIDYAFIRKCVNDLASEGRMRCLCVDPWNATQLGGQLQNEDGLPVLEVRQGTFSLSGPTRELERLALAGKFRHGGNPVLAWMARNCRIQTDVNKNIRLSKAASGKKIDGMSATVNALKGWMSQPPELTIKGPMVSCFTVEA